MATNLFVDFDSAFGPPVRRDGTKLAARVMAWLNSWAGRRVARRRQAQLWYGIRELPRHVRKDIGYLPWTD
jgi:hypothetical protein